MLRKVSKRYKIPSIFVLKSGNFSNPNFNGNNHSSTRTDHLSSLKNYVFLNVILFFLVLGCGGGRRRGGRGGGGGGRGAGGRGGGGGGGK